MNVIDNLVCIF